MAKMVSNPVFVVLLAALAASTIAAPPAPSNVEAAGEEVSPLEARALVSNDFENGMEPWFDFSNGDVNWYIETLSSPLETSPAPSPDFGTKYLRAVRKTQGASGTAVLRSPIFTAYPGDEVTFDFWIRSRHLQTNNLELYWENGTQEERILSLAEYSSPSNSEWRTVSVAIPLTEPAEIRLVFYGYCGYNEEDAIAIDNMYVGSVQNYTTPSTTTTTTAAPCPTYLGGNSLAPCFKRNTGCYCFYQTGYAWNSADTICRSYGARLVSIETSSKQSDIVYILNQGFVSYNNYLTSGKRNSATGPWYWSSTGQSLNDGYLNWESGEPNGSGDCLYLRSSFKWADASCSSSYYFICEV